MKLKHKVREYMHTCDKKETQAVTLNTKIKIPIKLMKCRYKHDK